MATIQSYINELPAYDITLKRIDMNDSVVGGANSSNQNFAELEKLLNTFNLAIKELASIIDIEAITNATLEKLEKDKKMFPLHFGLSELAEPEQVTYYDRVYNITRVDELTFQVSRFIGLDTEDWDVSRLVCQVKDNDGIVANVMIATRESSIIIRFQDIPETDHFLHVI